MKALIIDLEHYRNQAVNEARQARLNDRLERSNRPREIGGYPWRNITPDEAMEFLRRGE